MKKKTDLQLEARELYSSGKTYNEIVSILSVAKSSVSLWCRDLANLRRESIIPKTKAPSTSREFIKGVKAEFPYDEYMLYQYTGDDGVSRVNLYDSSTKNAKSMSLARYRMSVKEKRILDKTELVVHLNGKSDDISNLAIKTREQLYQEHAIRTQIKCAICDITFVPSRKTTKVCSNACKYKLISRQRLNGKIKTEKKFDLTCVMCNKSFSSTSHKAETCSKTCFDEKRRSMREKEIKRRTSKIYNHTCVICEKEFESTKKQAEVCPSRECINVMKHFDYS